MTEMYYKGTTKWESIPRENKKIINLGQKKKKKVAGRKLFIIHGADVLGKTERTDAAHICIYIHFRWVPC